MQEQQERRIVTLLHVDVEGQKAEAFTEKYRRFTPELLQNTPAMQQSLLGRNNAATESTSFVIVAQWQNEKAYRAWEESPEHRAALGPLREYIKSFRSEAFENIE